MVLIYHLEIEEWAGCGEEGGVGEVEQVGVMKEKIIVMNVQCHQVPNSPQCCEGSAQN